jgi:hypothetical protein
MSAQCPHRMPLTSDGPMCHVAGARVVSSHPMCHVAGARVVSSHPMCHVAGARVVSSHPMCHVAGARVVSSHPMCHVAGARVVSSHPMCHVAGARVVSLRMGAIHGRSGPLSDARRHPSHRTLALAPRPVTTAHTDQCPPSHAIHCPVPTDGVARTLPPTPFSALRPLTAWHCVALQACTLTTQTTATAPRQGTLASTLPACASEGM